MWLKTKDKRLINLDHVIAIYEDEFEVVATTTSGTFTLCDGNEDMRDVCLQVLSVVLEEEDAWKTNKVVNLESKMGGKWIRELLRQEDEAKRRAMLAQNVLAVAIEEAGLSQRTYHCLKRQGISTVAEAATYSEEELFNIRNFGQKSLDELRATIEKFRKE